MNQAIGDSGPGLSEGTKAVLNLIIGQLLRVTAARLEGERVLTLASPATHKPLRQQCDVAAPSLPHRAGRRGRAHARRGSAGAGR